MKLLLKVKNGTPPQRKSALRQLTDKARDLGAGPLFNQILPLLMSPTLEDQERHLLVKVRTPLTLSSAAVHTTQMLRKTRPFAGCNCSPPSFDAKRCIELTVRDTGTIRLHAVIVHAVFVAY